MSIGDVLFLNTMERYRSRAEEQLGVAFVRVCAESSTAEINSMRFLLTPALNGLWASWAVGDSSLLNIAKR